MDYEYASGIIAKSLIVGAISISEEEFHQLNASKHAVKVPQKLGGGFIALPEFVHQIHCVVRAFRSQLLIVKR